MGDSGDRAREEFFSEAQEIIEGLGRDLLALDEGVRKGRTDPDVVNDVFRAVHTLKGLAGLFGAARMSTLSHQLESLLDDLRLGRIDCDASVLDLLFRAIDIYGRILQQEKEGRDQPAPDMDRLLADLARTTGARAAASDDGDYDLDPSLLAVLTEYEEHRLRTNINEGQNLYRLRVQFQLATIDESLDRLKALAKPHGEIITYLPTGAGADADSIELDILMASRTPIEVLADALEETGVEITEVARRDASAAPLPGPAAIPGSWSPSPALGHGTGMPSHPGVPDVSSLMPSPKGTLPPRMTSGGASADRASLVPPGKPEEAGSLRSVTQTVRVDIHRLDRLMNVVGELSIVRASFERLIERIRDTSEDRELTTDLLRLQRSFERHLESMQQGILEVRMVPLGQVFDKLARVARQISREAKKQVNLVITGAETEVDKLIVEELSDPLMHMMRNAIDHGIEDHRQRELVGKPEVGTIALNAFQKGNHVVIEIEDDGGGIDVDRLVHVALSRGLITADEVRTSSRRDILNLIFVPGLSTRADVSELSGRGVGMDVVKTNIGKLGGVIDLTSEAGTGTKFTVTLPITLAIISALIVRVASELFAIPLTNIQEAVVLDESNVRKIDGRDVMTLRGVTLRLCYLSHLFRLDDLDTPIGFDEVRAFGGTSRLDPIGGMPGRRYVVVCSVGAIRLGLVVDRLIGGQDVVIKPLGPSLQRVRGFAGAAELGDQRLGLVIDAPGLIEETHEGDRGRQPLERGAHG